MNYRYLGMTPDTAAEVALLEQRCFSDPWSETSLLEELNNETAFWIVAQDAETDRVVGYGGIHVLFDEGEIMNIAVDPTCRRQGIGEALVTALLDHAKETQAVFLEVRVSNAPAIRLYEKLGFETIAVRKGYYSHPTEDAGIMRKEMKK